MEYLLAGIGGLIAGGAVAWLMFSARTSAARATLIAKLETTEQQLTERTTELAGLRTEQQRSGDMLRAESERRAAAEQSAARVPELEARLAALQAEASVGRARIAELETQITEERKAAEDKLALLNAAQATLSDAFKALSADALKSNNQAFIELAKATLEKFQEGAKNDLEARKTAVDELVRPLRESLEKVDGKLGELEKSRIEAYSALNEQLKGLVDTHLPRLHDQTANLVKALRQPTVRGRWGEMQLKRVVEMAGMVEYCDFIEQENRTTEEGRFRPDLIVRLPGGKSIVVDAKAPVAAYLDAAEAQDDDTRNARLIDHARQVRAHMTALGRKAYWEQFDPTPEFVVLFLPGEMFFSAALQQDPALIEFGVNERVIPATPTTLIALLRAVAYGWRQEALAQNAQEISALGKELYKRLSDLASHWSDVGKNLGRATDAYNRATGTLETRVLVSARRFRDLASAPEGVEIENTEPLGHAPRALQAPELATAAMPVADDAKVG